jgi:hypothetical protein
MFIKASFTTRWYWQIALICNLAKIIGAKTTFYSGGTGSDYVPHPMEQK